MRTRGFTLIELMIVVVIMGILVAIAMPNFIRMVNNAKEAAVKSNCRTTQLAAEDFAVQNDALYPGSTADALPSGETMLNLLPRGVRLENPFTKVRSEPVDGAPVAPGSTGYQVLVSVFNTNTGYTIIGNGHNAAVITVISGP